MTTIAPPVRYLLKYTPEPDLRGHVDYYYYLEPGPCHTFRDGHEGRLIGRTTPHIEQAVDFATEVEAAAVLISAGMPPGWGVSVRTVA